MGAEITVEIINKRGLHARAAAKFVKVVAAYGGTQIGVTKKGQNGEGDSTTVTGSSILGLMMLGADPGSKLFITADGPQAQEAINALKELVENRFDEAE